MKETILKILAFVFLIGGVSIGGINNLNRHVDYVGPLFVSQNLRWFYFNSVSRSFGRINLCPGMQTKYSWQSDYLYKDKYIRCFSHIHAWQMSDVAVLPEMIGQKDVYF